MFFQEFSPNSELPGTGHVHKYETGFGYFVDIWIVVTFWSIINLQSGY